jgi:hypothetical protein
MALHWAIVFAVIPSIITCSEIQCRKSPVTTVAEHENAFPRPLGLIQSHSARAIAFSPDGKTIASADDEIRLDRLTTGENLSRTRTNFDSSETCRSLAFSPDGKRLAAVYQGAHLNPPEFVVIWDITDEGILQNSRTLLARKHSEADLPGAVHHVEFSPDGRTLIFGSPDGTIYLSEALTGRQRLHFKGGVTAAFAADGLTLICVGHHGTISHRKPANGDLMKRGQGIATQDLIYIAKAAFAPNGKITALCDEYTLCLKHTESGDAISRLDFQGYSIDSLCFSPNCKMLAVKTDNIIRLIDTTTGRQHCCWKCSDGEGKGIAFSSDGKCIAWGEKDVVRIQELATILKLGEKPKQRAKTDPENVPLRIDIVPEQERFECGRG